MALAKHAEEIQEKIDEKMAMTEYTFKQEHKLQENPAKTTVSQSRQKVRDDEFRAMFAEESCFM